MATQKLNEINIGHELRDCEKLQNQYKFEMKNMD